MDDNFESYSDVMPDGSVPVAGLKIGIYLNTVGTTCYRFEHAGDAQVTLLVGVLEMIKADLIDAGRAVGRRRAAEEG